MPVATRAKVDIHYETHGAGSDVLMLLPQSRGPQGIDAFLQHLSLKHRVIRYDQRGTGASSAWSAPLSMRQQADDAHAVIDACASGRVHVLGHSTGCGIAVALANAYSECVASVSLISPWTWGDPYLTVMQQLRIHAAQALDPVAYARFNFALLYPPEYRRRHHEAFEDLAQAATMTPHDAEQIARRLNAILDYDARPGLPQLTSPGVVISGRDDQLMPPWFGKEAAGLMPDTEFYLLDGGGHMLLETRPGEVAEKLETRWALI